MLRLSQFLLLQTAADDALVRLKKSGLSEEEVKFFQRLYNEHQHHHSLREFLEYECRVDHEVFMQVCPAPFSHKHHQVKLLMILTFPSLGDYPQSAND